MASLFGITFAKFFFNFKLNYFFQSTERIYSIDVWRGFKSFLMYEWFLLLYFVYI